MAITIDEVTAEVAPAERGVPAAPPPDERQESPADLRRQRERGELLERRAARVKAD